MQRLHIEGRSDWQRIVEEQGFVYHSTGGPYWNEHIGYRFREEEIKEIESATNELHRICLEAVDHVVQKNLFSLFGIPVAYESIIRDSWNAQDLSIYGRFDLRYDGESAPKLFEYNADTPTSLLEAARIQAGWQRDLFGTASQFNSIEEKLVAAWRAIGKRYPRIHFSSVVGHSEDMGNVEYMRSLASRAGIDTRFLFIEEVEWSNEQRRFSDQSGKRIDTWFKLYPWEWILEDPYAEHLRARTMNLIEPAWKLILSSKAILPILWELFPGHPNLLPAYFNSAPLHGQFVRKPIFGREGANIAIESGEVTQYVPGPYGGLPSVFQQFCPLPQFSQLYTLVGSWVIGGKAAGIGIRESMTLISENRSRFIPHFVQ